MHRIPSVNQPQVSLLSNVYWVFSLPYSPCLGNPLICLPSTPGSNEVRRPGMRLMSTSKGQFGEQGSRLIVDGVPIPVTIRVNGSGYRPVINVFDCLAENSVPGTWVPSKILRQITPVSFRLALPAKLPYLTHFSCVFA